MKIIKLTRPALDPRRDLHLRMLEAQAGLCDFVQAIAPPSGWLEVELLDVTENTRETPSLRAICRR